jgi:hypothetical protein
MRPRISAHVWNRLLDELVRWWPLGFDAAEVGQWRHPWFTAARWNAEERRWEARVKPGFVNGLDPTVRVLDARGESRDVGLTETPGPVVPLVSFRTPQPTPDFFVPLGVAKTPAVDGGALLEAAQSGGPVAVAGLLGEAMPTRLLRACDLVLHQPRARTEIDVVTDGLGGAAGTGAQFRVRYVGSVGRSYLRPTSLYQPTVTGDLASLVQGTLTDAGEDTRLVATVFFLGPEGVLNPDVPVDETWTPFVKHGLFWNLAYSSPSLLYLPDSAGLRIDVPLAAGVATPVINQLLSQVNDANSALAQFLAARRAEGRFWSV